MTASSKLGEHLNEEKVKSSIMAKTFTGAEGGT